VPLKRVGDLGPAQRALLRQLSATDLAQTFYLTGGAALAAFYLHHRESLDIDLFSREPFDAKKVVRLVNSVAEGPVVPHRVHDRYEFAVPIAGEVLRVEFMHYDFDLVAPSGRAYLGIRVDSLRDILANKLSAILERSEPKDYVDILFLLRHPDLSLATGIEDCRKKFGWPGLEHVLQTSFLRATTIAQLPATDPPLSAAELQGFFRELAKTLVRAEVEGG